MVDLSRIQKSDNIFAGAAAGMQKAEKEKKEELKKPAPFQRTTPAPASAAMQNGAINEIEQIDEIEADTIIDKIDHDLKDLQELIKNVLSEKIKRADKNAEAKHELLVSAYNDCKNAYLKLNEVRGNLS